MSFWYRNAVGISILRREWSDEVSTSRAERDATRLFVALRDPVYLYLARILRDAAAAEDLTQEAFLSLYSTLQKGTSVTDPRAWVFRVAHNLAINWLRKIKTHAEEGLESGRPLATELSDPRPDAEQIVLNEEKYRRIDRAMRRLSQQERECLDLRLEGLRYREIAEVMGLSVSSVATVVERAIAKLVRETQ